MMCNQYYYNDEYFAIKELRKFIQENKESVGKSDIHLSKQCIKFLFVLI